MSWIEASLVFPVPTSGRHYIVIYCSFSVNYQLISIAINRHNNVVNNLHKQVSFKCKLVNRLRMNPRIFWQISPGSCTGTAAMVTQNVPWLGHEAVFEKFNKT